MNLSKMIVVAAAALVAGTASAGVVVYPDDTLGTLSALPALYGDLKSTSKAAGALFSDDFFFDLAAKSTVTGSVGAFFGTVSFSSVLIDGAALTLSATPTGYGFSLANLGVGTHTLTLAGPIPKGCHAYIRSLYATPAVPEPKSLALSLAGVGVLGMVSARHRRVH